MAIAFALLGWLMAVLAGSDRGMEFLPGKHGSVEFLLPAAPEWSIDEVSRRPQEEWQPWKDPDIAKGLRGGVIWLRIKLANPDPETTHGILANDENYLDHADLFIPDGAGSWRHRASGEWAAPARKALWGRETAFPLTIPANGEEIVYLRAQDYFSTYVRPVWWPDQNAFHAARMHHMLAEGLYFGMLLALLFYNAVLWVRVRFAETGPYLVYLMCFTIFIAVSRGDVPFSGHALGSPMMEIGLTGALALSGVFLIEFARRFLELPRLDRRTAEVLRFSQGLLILLALASAALPWVSSSYWLAGIWIGITGCHLTLLWAVAIAWKKGARGLRYLVPAFGFVLSGLLPLASVLVEIFPLDRFQIIVMTGSALEMMLLSIAMAYRYAGLQRDKIAAQQALLVEAEQRQILQEAYADELELEVHERTREIQSVMADKDRMIAILAHDLRSPLIALTRRAEQLSDDAEEAAVRLFTKEAAVMGEQLLSLIGDLVSWAGTRGGTGTVARHQASSVVEPILALHREAALRRGLVLEAKLPESQEVNTDLVQAQTLVRNLLSNAVKYAKSRVEVSASHVPHGVRLSVRDDGPGISPEMVRKVSDGEFSLHGDRLGLRLCREIVRALGIQLEIVPADGGGTEISFILGVPEEAS